MEAIALEAKSLQQLIDQAERFLVNEGYKPTTVAYYRATWDKLEDFCRENDIGLYTYDIGRQFLESQKVELCRTKERSQRKDRKIRHIDCLLSVDKDNRLPDHSGAETFILPRNFGTVYAAYETHLKTKGIKEITRTSHLSCIKRFLVHLDIGDVKDLAESDIVEYMESVSWMAPQTKSLIRYQLRAFLRFLASEGFASKQLALMFPVIPGDKYAVLPSSYTTAEIACLLEADLGAHCPKRNYAILLLGAELGMRVGDIRLLRKDSIDWHQGTIAFNQHKTDRPVVLPLTEEVSFALLDYLKNERPESDDSHVFLRINAPIGPLGGALHPVAHHAFSEAGVDTAGKHRGMHSLRHSAALNMLNGNTPYPVISGVLGHTSANTTRKYLQIDVEQLRALALEVPHG